jgi:hypothetical protein
LTTNPFTRARLATEAASSTTFTLSEADTVELLGALELAYRAAGLVPGSDATARRSTIADLVFVIDPLYTLEDS